MSENPTATAAFALCYRPILVLLPGFFKKKRTLRIAPPRDLLTMHITGAGPATSDMKPRRNPAVHCMCRVSRCRVHSEFVSSQYRLDSTCSVAGFSERAGALGWGPECC